MKRGGPLKRTSRLNPGTKRLRRGVLLRSSSLSRQAAAPTPAKRDPAEAGARKALRARSAGVCEVCGRASATDAHHRPHPRPHRELRQARRLARSQGGRWAIENLLHLCHAEHMHITVSPALAYERGWSVRSTFDPADVPVWLAGRGWSYLRADGSIESTERGAA